MNKKAKTTNYPKPPDKIPKVNEPRNYNKERPVWLLSKIDMDGDFGWKSINERDKILKIIDRLKSFESMTWADIVGSDNHSIPIYNLSHGAKKRLSQINIHEIEELFSFHLTGKERIWGIREEEKCKILWWDPDHLVCPSIKKHT